MNYSRIWVQNYIDGLTPEINPDAYKNILELMSESAKKYSNQPAYTFMDKNISFIELDNLSTNFAGFLQSKGLKKGDKIILQMPNILQYPIALFGALKAGLVCVNTNPMYTPREMLHQYNDSEATAVVILANFANHLQEILPKTKIQTVVITQLGDMLGGLKGGIVNFVVKNIKKMVPPFQIKEAYSFKNALNLGEKFSFKKVDIANTDVAMIQYTGGTTGVSKGAMLTHRNIIANVEGVTNWFHPLMSENLERKVLGALPLYHIFALTVNAMTGLKLGFHTILIVNPRDMKATMKDMKKHKLFILPGLNTLFIGMMNNPVFKELDFSNLRVTIAGGMALQKPVADKWEQLTNCRITEGYGLSETSPVLSCNMVKNQRIGTIGVPFPSTDMRILKEDGTWAAQGEVGEICGSGPQVMLGYYNRPDETAKVFMKDETGKEYFKTGDVGLMDENGFFKIVDRIKDMILVSGFNVYPNEIEEVVASIDGVLEVACIGVADDKTTEAVKIFVVKKDPSLSEQKIRDYCEENLTGYKRPKYIEFRSELPKTNVGKILRRELKEEEMKKA